MIKRLIGTQLLVLILEVLCCGQLWHLIILALRPIRPQQGGIRSPILYRFHDEAACSVTVGLNLKILLEKQQPFTYLPTKGTCSALKQTPTFKTSFHE
jgi:hypothetical protein